MSPRLLLPKHNVRAASHRVINLKNRSSTKPDAAPCIEERTGKNRKMSDRNGGKRGEDEEREQNGERMNGDRREGKARVFLLCILRFTEIRSRNVQKKNTFI